MDTVRLRRFEPFADHASEGAVARALAERVTLALPATADRDAASKRGDEAWVQAAQRETRPLGGTGFPNHPKGFR